MKFSTKVLLKEATKECAMKGTSNVKIVKKDKRRVRGICTVDVNGNFT